MTNGLVVDGVIAAIELHVVPSKFAGQAGKAVTRLTLDITQAVGPDGSAADRRLFTSPFQGVPELASAWHVGDRVRLETTTPTGLHIASIGPLGDAAGPSSDAAPDLDN